MTIENDLKRIADSLEVIAKHITETPDVKAEVPPAPPKADAPPAPPKADAPPAPPKADAPPALKAVPTPPKVETITKEELNAGLVEHYTRLGETREPIDKVMQEQFGVDTITDLDPSDYVKLLQAVSEIPSE